MGGPPEFCIGVLGAAAVVSSVRNTSHSLQHIPHRNARWIESGATVYLTRHGKRIARIDHSHPDRGGTDPFPPAIPQALPTSRYAEVSASASGGLIRLGQNDPWIIAEAPLIGIDVFVTQDSNQGRHANQWCAEAGIEITVHIAGA